MCQTVAERTHTPSIRNRTGQCRVIFHPQADVWVYRGPLCLATCCTVKPAAARKQTRDRNTSNTSPLARASNVTGAKKSHLSLRKIEFCENQRPRSRQHCQHTGIRLGIVRPQNFCCQHGHPSQRRHQHHHHRTTISVMIVCRGHLQSVRFQLWTCLSLAVDTLGVFGRISIPFQMIEKGRGAR